MNEQSKSELRKFKRSLDTAASEAGAKVVSRPRLGDGSFRVEALNNATLEVEITFTMTYGSPKAYFGNESKMLSNLTVPNLTAHLKKRLAARQADIIKQNEEDAKDNAAAEAEDAMAKHMTAFLPKSMKYTDPAKDDNEISHIWRSERGQFRLVYVHVVGTLAEHTFEYNVEYKFAAGLTRDIRLEGEFDVQNSRDMDTMLAGILQLGQH